MSVHRVTNDESLRAARADVQRLWSRVLRREANIATRVKSEVMTQPERYEGVMRERDLEKRERMIASIVRVRANDDQGLKDLTAMYDRAVATAMMYGVARLVELFDGSVLPDA
jgi:hypothetical protein